MRRFELGRFPSVLVLSLNSSSVELGFITKLLVLSLNTSMEQRKRSSAVGNSVFSSVVGFCAGERVLSDALLEVASVSSGFPARDIPASRRKPCVGDGWECCTWRLSEDRCTWRFSEERCTCAAHGGFPKSGWGFLRSGASSCGAAARVFRPSRRANSTSTSTTVCV